MPVEYFNKNAVCKKKYMEKNCKCAFKMVYWVLSGKRLWVWIKDSQLPTWRGSFSPAVLTPVWFFFPDSGSSLMTSLWRITKGFEAFQVSRSPCVWAGVISRAASAMSSSRGVCAAAERGLPTQRTCHHASRCSHLQTFQTPSLARFVVVQSLSHVWLFVTPWTAARQAPLSISNSQSLPKLMCTELVMPSNHLTLCRPLLLPPSIFPSIRVFTNESWLFGLLLFWFFIPLNELKIVSVLSKLLYKESRAFHYLKNHLLKITQPVSVLHL